MRRMICILVIFVAVLALTGELTGGSVNAQTACDFVTGGGFIIPATGAHGNFGVGGGCKHGSPTWGHLEYVDHGSGLAPTTAPTPFNVHGTDVTGYFFLGPTTREISGTARTNDSNNSPVNYCVHVTDNGPGSTDIFWIQLTDTNGVVYDTGPHTLVGGNIELHKPNPSNTEDFSTGSCLVLACGGFGSSCTMDSDCCAPLGCSPSGVCAPS